MKQQNASPKQETERRLVYPLTLDPKTAGEVDDYASAREWSKAKAAGRLIEIGLQALAAQQTKKKAA